MRVRVAVVDDVEGVLVKGGECKEESDMVKDGVAVAESV